MEMYRVDRNSSIMSSPLSDDSNNNNVRPPAAPSVSGQTVASQSGIIPELTPQEYREAISFHAKQTTRQSAYPGQNFEDLDVFLEPTFITPYTPTRPSFRVNGNRNSNASRSPSLNTLASPSPATLYTLQHSLEVKTANGANVYRKVDHLDNASQLPQYLQSTPAIPNTNGAVSRRYSTTSKISNSNNNNNDNTQYKSHVLFLAGYPTSEWLTTIGSLIQVDPQHYERHLSFLSRQLYYTSPSLPSTEQNIIFLRFITIGRRYSKGNTQEHIDRLRKHGASEMEQYRHHLKLNREVRPGDSIVRRYSVLDDEHFSIEQDISVSLNFTGKQWVALVLYDSGNDFLESIRGPWLDEDDHVDPPGTRCKTSFLPTIRHRAKLALKSKKYTLPLEEQGKGGEVPQVASLIRRDYGKLLDWPTMKLDPFYALHELFEYSAASELQFLNLVEDKLASETNYEALLATETVSLSNLLYILEILQAHSRRLAETIEKIKCRGSAQWPHAPENTESGKKAKEAADVLLRDYKFLQAKAHSLAQRCERSMTVIMNNANIAESKRAIEQAKRVGKLTMLAFFYVPLSFTASFFGMNFEQFATGPYLGVWVWFVVTIPVMLLSIAFYHWDMSKALEYAAEILSKVRHSWAT